MSSIKSTIALAGAFATTALAHGTVTGFAADGKYEGGYKLSYYYDKINKQPVPEVAAWSAENLDNGFVDGTGYATSDIACHIKSAPGATTASVAAGGKVDFFWSDWPESHFGPVFTYVANCGGDCSAADKATLEWVKIDEAGYNAETKKWAATDLIANNNTWTTTVPATLAAGNYVFRHEIIAMHGAYMAHVGEGVDAEAENEFRCLSSATYDTTPKAGGGGLSTDIIAPNLALIHALGLTKSDFDLVAARHATVVWSPRSNVFLYGKTLDVQYLLDAGITVALGTDWLPSGSATMAREAVCGFAATKASYGHALDAKTLWEMMTINAAKVAGFDRHLGSFEVGKLADVAVFAGAPREDAFAQAVFSSGEDVELVMRGGKVLLAAEKIKRAATGACEPVVVGHSNKTLCVEEELGRSYAEFESNLGGVYPALLPGVPSGEPTCEPTR
ncbi:hypothetical protein BN1723_010783, partial [Verticillium longisporum]